MCYSHSQAAMAVLLVYTCLSIAGGGVLLWMATSRSDCYALSTNDRECFPTTTTTTTIQQPNNDTIMACSSDCTCFSSVYLYSCHDEPPYNLYLGFGITLVVLGGICCCIALALFLNLKCNSESGLALFCFCCCLLDLCTEMEENLYP